MKSVLIILGIAIVIIVLTVVVWMLIWSSKVSVTAQSNSKSSLGYNCFPERPITVHQAIELARPYLDESYNLRFQKRKRERGMIANMNTDWIHVSLKDEFYYIVKDDYPSYTPGFYLFNAVKVNALTGDIIRPE